VTPGHAKAQLLQLRAWAKERIATGVEPPWAWYQYMKLIETADAIVGGLDSTTTNQAKPVSSPESGEHSGTALRLVESIDPQDSSPPHSRGVSVRLPM
jgi:hypothetical protein